jgi:hypothetical protein
MKKLLLLLTISLFIRVSYAQVPKPAKPAFIVTYEERGKNGNGSWVYTATIKFSLSNWNLNVVRKGNSRQSLELDPAGILKLEPGEKVKFYPGVFNESGSGDGASYSRVVTPDGTETLIETTGKDTKKTVMTDADYRKEHGIPTNENFSLNARYYQDGNLAELERTATGAILYAYCAVGDNLGEWSVSDEAMQQVFPAVETFVLTDNDIRAWQKISRTNTITGTQEDDKLTVKITVNMADGQGD